MAGKRLSGIALMATISDQIGLGNAPIILSRLIAKKQRVNVFFLYLFLDYV